MRRSKIIPATVVIAIIMASLLSYLTLRSNLGQQPLTSRIGICTSDGIARIQKTHVTSVKFDAVTKFHLPSPEKFPNSIFVMPDGSAWFGEELLPGVAHIFINGTLIEYAWPFNYSPSTTSTWGIVPWQGRIWASDELGDQLVGLDVATGAIEVVKLSTGAFPYTMRVGPTRDLWFTELFGSKLGRLGQDCKLEELHTPKAYGGTPTDIAFLNSTLAFYVDAGNVTSGIGNLVAFNPTTLSLIGPVKSGKSPLYAPSGVSFQRSRGVLWITQHGASGLSAYDLRTRNWVVYPTSTVSYQNTTLPYFVYTNDSIVWFNEHYANRIGMLNTTSDTLTEYSISDPPVTNITKIDNALTMGIGGSTAWFTGLTANVVGYVTASYHPSFMVSMKGVSSANRNSTLNLTLIIHGESTSPLVLKFSDSENPTARPVKIYLRANVNEVASMNARKVVTVTLQVSKQLIEGQYTVLVTATNGLISRGAYVKIHVPVS